MTMAMSLLLHRHLFFVILTCVAGADLLMWQLQVPPSDWVQYTYAFVLVVLVVLEFVAPRNASWNYVTRDGVKVRELTVDVFFLILETLVLSAATYLFATWVAGLVRAALGLSFVLPLHWTLQCLAAVLLVDLVRYWVHRASHRFAWMWRLHSMPERLGAMSSARGNPFDDVVTYAPELIVLFTLGFDREVMLGLYSVIWIMPLVIHSNVDFAETRFSRFFQLPRYHLIHHAYNDGNAPTHNFAELLTVWDRVFGTFKDDPIGVDHRTGVVRDRPRTWLREFFGWLYLPIQRL
jgi:sterol desaturase/sphingolipid hydroxylase (fatty acid hydroxylase superfamily)